MTPPPRSGRRTAARLALGLALGLAGCARPVAEKPRNPAGPARAIEDTPSPFFELDARPFCFAGANNYYLGYATPARVDDVLEQARALGLGVLRVFAHLERGSLDGSVPALDGDGTRAGVYYQHWDPVARAPAYNDGANGLERLDYLLSAARRRGLKLLLVLTNNWRNFGGMDQYVTWYGLRSHDEFYRDARVKAAYKGWLSHVVTRKNSLDGTSYRDDPAVFGWELANAPRASDPALVTAWADEMSRFIKSLDANHMVTAGGEGFLARDALLALPAVDFGTFQLEPEYWQVEAAFAAGWISEQLEAARRADKPALLEAYSAAPERREGHYVAWNAQVRREGGSGALVRTFVGRHDFGGPTPDLDGASFTANTMLGDIMRGIAAAFPRDSRACALADGTRTGLGTKLVRARKAPARP